MKKIIMTKYGFKRWPERDFSDDGSRFTCYKAGKTVRASKLVSDGQVYLSIESSCGGGSLPYEIYSKLPHYQDVTWKYNGVSVASLTDEDLKNFYEACLAYEKEYTEAEAIIEYPSLEALKDKAIKITAKRMAELARVESLLKEHGTAAIARLSSYQWARIQEYTKYLMAETKRFNPATYPLQISCTSASFDFVKPETHMADSYWFKSLVELFDKATEN